MEEELYKIFNDCLIVNPNENHEYKINIYQVITTIYKYKKNKKLKKFVIIKEKSKNNSLALYAPKDKKIFIFAENLALSGINNANRRCSDQLMILYEFIQVLIHEIEHSRQYSLIKDSKEKSLEKQLLSMTSLFDDKMLDSFLKRYIKESNMKVNRKEFKTMHETMYNVWDKAYKTKFYNCMLIERLAEYESYTTLLNVFNDDENFKLLKYISFAYLKNIMINGYKLEKGIVTCPTISTIEYFKENGFYRDIDFDWYDEDKNICLENITNLYDFKTRYKYGLPITITEYKDEVQKTKSANKRLKKKYGLSIEENIYSFN